MNITVTLHNYEIDDNELIVSYSANHGSFLNERIPLLEFRVWVEKEGFLSWFHPVMLLNEHIDDNYGDITFDDYLAHQIEWKHVENFLADKIRKESIA